MKEAEGFCGRDYVSSVQGKVDLWLKAEVGRNKDQDPSCSL